GEVVVEHPLGGAGTGRDLIDARAGVAVPGELAQRHVQDLLAGPLRVTLPLPAFAGRGAGHQAESTVNELEGSLAAPGFTTARGRAQIMNYQVSSCLCWLGLSADERARHRHLPGCPRSPPLDVTFHRRAESCPGSRDTASVPRWLP